MLQVNNLTFHYPGAASPAVQGLNFSNADGELFGFLGPSGAGKSTTQKILNGLLRDYMGTVAVFGKNLTEWQSEYYERIGVSFEFPNHFLKLTALENLTYFSKLYSRKYESPQTALEWVGLADAGKMLVSQFSKGMKTRLSVARALLHRPDFLFLDEPTAGLDPVNAFRIKEIIKFQKRAGLVRIDIRSLLLSAASAAALAPFYALMLPAFCSNKVPGFALTKALGVLLVPPVVAYILPFSWEWLLGIVPLYWPAKLFWVLQDGENGVLFYLGMGLFYQFLVLFLLLRRFNKRMHIK